VSGKLVASAVATVVAVVLGASVQPAAAQHTSFTDPAGDGGPAGTRYEGLDLRRYHVAYNDSRGLVRLHFADLTRRNFLRIVWYVNPRGPGFGHLGVGVNRAGHERKALGHEPCAEAAAGFDRHTDVATLTFPGTCVDHARSIRVMAGVEGHRYEDWTRGFSEPVLR
jgi:hypothetical protein